MTELPPDPALEARLRDYLAAELRQARLDYPHHARPERAVARRRLPIGVALAAIAVLAAVVLAPQLLGPVFQGPAAIPMGDDGLPLSIDGQTVLRGEAIAGHAGTGGFLAGGTLVLSGVERYGRCVPGPRLTLRCTGDWWLHPATPDNTLPRYRLDAVEDAPGFVPTSGALTVARVRWLDDAHSALAVDSVAWRQPTKGRIPDEAVPAQGGDINEALVPDFVGVWGTDGVTIAGYMPKRYALGGGGTTTGGTPSSPPQDLPTPVYGEDLVTLVGHMVAGVGFVALGSTETPVPPSASVAPSPAVSTAPATDPLPVISPVVDCGRIGADACKQAIVLARAVGGSELAGTSRIVVDDACSPAVICDRKYPFDSLVVFVTAGADTTGWITYEVTGLEDNLPTTATRWPGDLPAHIVARLVAASPTASSAPAQSPGSMVSCDPPGTWTTTDAAGSAVPVLITLTCDKAVGAAWARLGADPAIAAIEFHYYDYFPPGRPRGSPTDPNVGHVIFHPADGRPDMLFPVRSDGAGNVVAEGPEPLPTPSGG